jgi:signal transduction histidine kinase
MTDSHAPHIRHSILVVDDDPVIVRILHRILSRDGFEVWTASDAAETFAIIAERLPCLLITDVMLPDVDGLEICRRLTVLCHVGDLNQVFLNLIVNAAHAIGEVVGQSGTRGRIRIRTLQEGHSVRNDIADTGSGISESIRHRPFEPFFTTKEVGKGTGQGLAIARSVVVIKHHGSLDFDTEMGRGTTFTIRLPIDGQGAEATEEPRSSVATGSSCGNAPKTPSSQSGGPAQAHR